MDPYATTDLVIHMDAQRYQLEVDRFHSHKHKQMKSINTKVAGLKFEHAAASRKKRREHAAAEAFGLGAVLGGEDGNVELDAWPCLGATAASSRKTGVDAGGVAGRPRHRARVGWPVPAACVDTHLWCRLPRALIGWPYRPRPVAAEWENYSSRRENDLGFVLNIYMHP